MSTFFIITTSIFILGWLYTRSAFKRIILSPFKLSTKWCFAWDGLFLLMILVSYLYRNNPQLTIDSSLLFTGYFIMGMIGISLLLFLLADLLKVSTKSKFNQERRDFFSKSLSLGTAGTSLGLTALGSKHALSLELQTPSIPLEPSFSKLSGLKILQLSDLHFGPVLKKDFALRIMDEVQGLNPDLIVITGDLIDGKVENLKEDLSPLKNLSAPLGVFYIPGNHEYYWGVQEWIDFVPSLGWIPLINQHKVLSFKGEQFVLAGMTDKAAFRIKSSLVPDPKKALQNSPENLYKILLAHRPKSIDVYPDLSFNLMLSGHTHGGQGYPWKFLVGLVQPYLKGLYQVRNKQIYVNGATGFWGPPYKLGQKGEITLIELKA